MTQVLAQAPIVRKNKRQKVELKNHSHDGVDENKIVETIEYKQRYDETFIDMNSEPILPQYTEEQIKNAPMRGNFKAEKQNRDFPRVVKDDNGMNATVDDISDKQIVWEELEVTAKPCEEWPAHDHYPHNVQDWKEYMMENAFTESDTEPLPDEVYDEINEKQIETDFKSGLIVDNMVSWNNWRNVSQELIDKHGKPQESKMAKTDEKTKDAIELINDITSLEESLEELDNITNYNKFNCQWRDEVSKIHEIILKLKGYVLENPNQPMRKQLSSGFQKSALDDIKQKRQVLLDYVDENNGMTLQEVDCNELPWG